jgi:cell division protein ZapA (FtsZ GTPase activity inhibitor)
LEEIITIKLFGQSYTFKAEQEVSNAGEVADLLVLEVDRIKKQLEGQPANMDKLTILALAALNITNGYLELKREHSDLLQEISRRSSSLVKSLEVAVK